MAESKININILPERDLFKRNANDENIRAALQVESLSTTIDKDKGSRPGVDMIFLLDSSSSMDDQFYASGKKKKEIVVDAAKKAAKLIDNKDTISVISFNSTAVLMLDHENKSAETKINKKIEEILEHGGQTNFEAALRLADKICQNKKNSSSKIIFLTDGQENAGNPKEALKTAEQIVAKGTTIDSMGIGKDFVFDVMRKYSALSGGITENLDGVDKTEMVFRQILKAGQSAVITNGNLNIHFEKGIRDVKLYQYFPEKRLFDENVTISGGQSFAHINIGEIPVNGAKEYAISCNTDLPDDSNFKIADISVSYNDPATSDNNVQDIQWLISLGGTQDSSKDSRVEDCFKKIELLIDYESAKKDYTSGNRDQAIKRLGRLIDTAYDLGQKDEAKIYEDFRDKIQRREGLTQEEMNKLSFISSRGTDRITGQVKRKTDGKL